MITIFFQLVISDLDSSVCFTNPGAFQVSCKFILRALDNLKWDEELISLGLFIWFLFCLDLGCGFVCWGFFLFFFQGALSTFFVLFTIDCFSNTMKILQQHLSSQGINLKTFKRAIHFSLLFLCTTTNVTVKESYYPPFHVTFFLIMILLGNICCIYCRGEDTTTTPPIATVAKVNNSDLKGSTTKPPYFTPNLSSGTVTSVPENSQQHFAYDF